MQVNFMFILIIADMRQGAFVLQVPVSIADLGGTEIDLRFGSSKEGRLFVIVAPVRRFSDGAFPWKFYASCLAFHFEETMLPLTLLSSDFFIVLWSYWRGCNHWNGWPSRESNQRIWTRSDWRKCRRKGDQHERGGAFWKNILSVWIGASSCYNHSDSSRKSSLPIQCNRKW